MNYESSDIDWCEDNYTHSPYIVEFYNTISNIPFILFYAIGLRSFRYMSCQDYDYFLYGCLFFTGISSFYFHATLSLYSQLLDEFSIIFLLCNTLLMLYKDTFSKKCIKGYTITHSIVMCYYPWINIPVLFFIGFYLWLILRKRFNKYTEPSFRKYWRCAQFFFVCSVICWLLDKFLCNIVKKYNLHACWHILSAICAYYSILVGIFLEYHNNKYKISEDYCLPIIIKK